MTVGASSCSASGCGRPSSSAHQRFAFSVWFFTIGRDGRVSMSASRIPEIPAFVWQGLTGSLGSLFGIPGAGAVLLVALVVAAALAPWSRPWRSASSRWPDWSGR